MVTKLTSFRFTPEDLVVLDACQAHVGVNSKTEAVRSILRAYARAEGLLQKVTPHTPVRTPGKTVSK